MAMMHRHSSNNHQRRREKELFKIGLSEEKDNITPLSGTSAGNTLTFPQVFFISLIQVCMSSKIRAVLKGKKHLFMLKHCKCYLGKPLTLFSTSLYYISKHSVGLFFLCE